MCDPVTATTAISTALQIGGSVLQFSQQADAAKENAKAANKAAASAYAGTTLRQQQENAKAAQDKFDVNLQMEAAKATAATSAGESGVGGVSFANLLTDYESRAGRANAVTDANAQATVAALQSDKESTNAKTAAVINSVPAPSPLGLFADIGAQVAKGGLKIWEDKDPSLKGK